MNQNAITNLATIEGVSRVIYSPIDDLIIFFLSTDGKVAKVKEVCNRLKMRFEVICNA